MLGITMSSESPTTATKPILRTYLPRYIPSTKGPVPTPTKQQLPIACRAGYHYEPIYGCVANPDPRQSTPPIDVPPVTASNDQTAPPNEPSGGGTTATMTTPGGGGATEQPITRLPPPLPDNSTPPIIMQPTPATPWWKWAIAGLAGAAIAGGVYYGTHR